MSIRSVRLDTEAENALTDIITKTGLSISAAIKQGLLEYRTKASSAQQKPSAFFKTFDLGRGGYAVAPARQAKNAIRKKLQAKRAK